MRGWLLPIWRGLIGVHAPLFCQKDKHYDLICLRNHYQKPSSQWHPPTVDEGVVWLKLAPIVIDDKPPTPIAILGGQLFFLKPHYHQMGGLDMSIVMIHFMGFQTQELFRLACMAGKAVVIASL